MVAPGEGEDRLTLRIFGSTSDTRCSLFCVSRLSPKGGFTLKGVPVMTTVHLQPATKVLFRGHDDYVFLEVLRILEKSSLSECDRYRGLLNLCAVVGDHTVVAKIVVAAVANSLDSSTWLEKAATIFGTDPFVFEKEPPDPNCFVDGVVLGLFQASNWIDANRGCSTAFEREFFRAVVKVITGHNDLLRRAEELYKGKKVLGSLSVGEEKFGGELTNAVHAYVHCTGMREARKLASFQGVRLADVQRIIDGACDHLSQDKSNRQLTRWGELVLDNIAYAFFGQMAPFARAQALKDYVDKLVGFGKEEDPQERFREFRRLDVREEGGVAVVRFRDRKIIEDQQVQEIGEELFGLVEKLGVNRILLSLGGVDYVASSVMGKWMTLDKKVKARGGVLKLSNVRREIYEVLAITKLNRLFDIRDNEADALAAF